EDWLNQDLSAWRALQMRLHLTMCKGCGRFIDQMGVTRNLTETAARVEPELYTDIDAILALVDRDGNPGADAL
ncbi:MAG: hypothetical protein U1D06_11285, partial [Paracoccaceae bacterium]|nr:hypothetical protein [Paracoccaceae bacterium]